MNATKRNLSILNSGMIFSSSIVVVVVENKSVDHTIYLNNTKPHTNPSNMY